MLPRLEGYAAALLGSLDRGTLAAVSSDLDSLEQTILARADLHAVLTDTSITGAARGNVVRDLLAGKLHAQAVSLATYGAHVAPAQEVPHSLGELAFAARLLLETGEFEHGALSLMAARERVGGFADALLDGADTASFAGIEEDLFRWARAVEANEDLRRLLLDRDAPLASRVGATRQLLTGKVSDIALRLSVFVIEGGRPRDVVGTLDFLVDYVARARDWRVARVHTARSLDETTQSALVTSLVTLTGHQVELQIAEEPDLLGGVLVEVGDLRLDATTQGRLGALRESVTSGHLFQSALNRND
jgi:F-type H+-transporting ATPase subunit delta